MLGERIRDFREMRGWSRKQLAYYSGIPDGTVGAMERNQNSRNYVGTVFAISSALGVTMEELIGDPANLALAARQVERIRSLNALIG